MICPTNWNQVNLFEDILQVFLQITIVIEKDQSCLHWHFDININITQNHECKSEQKYIRSRPAKVSYVSDDIKHLLLIFCTRPLVSPFRQNRLVSQNSWNFTNFTTNTRHVCSYFNVFSMVIPNKVTKFQNFDIFSTFCDNFYCRLLTRPAAWKGLIHVH